MKNKHLHACAYIIAEMTINDLRSKNDIYLHLKKMEVKLLEEHKKYLAKFMHKIVACILFFCIYNGAVAAPINDNDIFDIIRISLLIIFIGESIFGIVHYVKVYNIEKEADENKNAFLYLELFTYICTGVCKYDESLVKIKSMNVNRKEQAELADCLTVHLPKI